MAAIQMILLLLVLVIVSNVLSHYVLAIPVSLIQAVLGLVVALAFSMELTISTEWFMLLFTAPLLYSDGRRFPKKELWQLRGPIIGNAIILVLVLTFLGGLFIHWLIPMIPLPASFALAAIMAPTDPVAVQNIAARAKLPSELLHLISGESLINDASGLIGFKYGIAATLTGSFILGDAVLNFVYVALIGALAGAVLMTLINWSRTWLLVHGINDVILHTVLQVVTPFLIYLITDELLGASGVIAVVVAGLMTNTNSSRYIAAIPELRLVSERVWDTIIYVLNGLIFLILGIELPVAMTATIESRQFSTAQAILDVFLVYFVMLMIRVVWTYGNMLVNARKNGGTQASWRAALLNGIAGVRGAVTLVGILAVPLTLADGSAFPQRGLMLFIAAGFVVVSLIAAVIFIPLLTESHAPLELRGSGLPNADETGTLQEASEAAVEQDDPTVDGAVQAMTLAQAQRYVYQVATHQIEGERRQDNAKPALDLIAEYSGLLRRVDVADEDTALPPIIQDEIALRGVGLSGELAALEQLFANEQISRRTYDRNRRILLTWQRNLDAHTKSQTWRARLQISRERLIGRVQRARYRNADPEQRATSSYAEQLFTEKELAKAGLQALSGFLKQPEQRAHGYNRQVIYGLIVQYRNRIASIKALDHLKANQYEKESQRLRSIGIAAERAAIHDLRERGSITNEMAQSLAQKVNYKESALTMATLTDV